MTVLLVLKYKEVEFLLFQLGLCCVGRGTHNDSI